MLSIIFESGRPEDTRAALISVERRPTRKFLLSHLHQIFCEYARARATIR
jgi:hypothetical protein